MTNAVNKLKSVCFVASMGGETSLAGRLKRGSTESSKEGSTLSAEQLRGGSASLPERRTDFTG